MGNVKQQWMVINVLLTILRPVNVQYAMPMFPPPPPMFPPPAQPIFLPPPPPVQVMMPAFAIRIPSDNNGNHKSTTTTTTTTTTEQTIAIAVPMPVPMPVQFAIPAPPPPQFCQNKLRPPNCPPCPPCVCFPSCTPAFFAYCSPCHLKCKCKNKDDTPAPMPPHPPIPMPGPAFPVPMPQPAPIIVVPYPPPFPRPTVRPSSEMSSDASSSSSTETDSSSEDCDKSGRRSNSRHGNRHHNKKHHSNGRRMKKRWKSFDNKRMHHSRRTLSRIDLDRNDNEFLKPVLSYVARNGDVMMQKTISNFDANQLLAEGNDNAQRVQVMTKDGPGKKSHLVVISDDMETEINDNKPIRRMMMRNGESHSLVGQGKKELVFKPPDDKRISNLSVSFQVN